MSNGKKITYWVLAGIPAAMFLVASFFKLTSSDAMVQIFTHFGYPLWFMYFIGIAELAGALGLLFGSILHPILPRLAALGLIILMLGAVVSHGTHDPIVMAIPAALVIAVLVAFLYVGKQLKELDWWVSTLKTARTP